MTYDKWKRNVSAIKKSVLNELYVKRRKSMQQIANELDFSLHKVAYWMEKYKISRRTRSDAMYVKNNPDGDPFKFHEPRNIEEAILFGLGLGLYWGEGTKSNPHSIRLGNTDPRLICKFIEFLIRFFEIEKNDLRFGLQIFSDIDPNHAIDFWIRELAIHKNQINNPVVTKSGSLGTYHKKSQYGVLTVMYHNMKLRDAVISKLPL